MPDGSGRLAVAHSVAMSAPVVLAGSAITMVEGRGMNVLAIGAGLVGCNFAREMKERGHRVVLYDLAPNELTYGMWRRHPSVRGNMQDLSALIEDDAGAQDRNGVSIRVPDRTAAGGSSL